MLTICCLAVAMFFPQAQQGTDMHHNDDVAKRGDQVMGFSHTTTAHHFRLFADGGTIEVVANDPNDKATIEQIRKHLSHIAGMFADGNFNAPMLIHGTTPPGTATMTKLKSEIRYDYAEIGRGARIQIVTGNSLADDAIHAFLLFQIIDHQTGDSPAIMESASSG
ncbi:MAG TPA: hypothetical protein VN862_11285 [Candidatus Acidoferrales bacterium]|nr:hypothetical protein [Candidatus Acidoferrales bacterium]